MSAARTRANASPAPTLALPASAIWGNRNGWISAALLGAALIGLLAFAYASGTQTDRTTLSQTPENLTTLTLPASDAQLNAIAPTPTPGDGSALLQAAVSEATATRGLLDNWLAKGGRADPAEIEPLLAQTRAAARHQRLTLFPDPAAVIVYPNNNTRRELRAIKDLGKALLHAGLLREVAGDHEDARADYEAAFLLGRRLFEQRLVEEQLTYGVLLMREAAEGMVSVREASGGDATMPRAIAQALATWQAQRIEPMRQVFVVEDAAITGTHVGDYRALVAESQEPVWRVESVLTLGRHRFNAAREPDQIAAGTEVKRLATEADDPHVRLAAERARDLELAEHRLVRFGRY